MLKVWFEGSVQAVTPGAIFAVLINDVGCDQVSVVLECDQIIKADMRHTVAWLASSRNNGLRCVVTHDQQTSDYHPNGYFQLSTADSGARNTIFIRSVYWVDSDVA